MSIYGDYITCPNTECGQELYDSEYYMREDEEERIEVKCPKCGLNFRFTKEVSVHYWCEEDCSLNGKEHNFVVSKMSPLFNKCSECNQFEIKNGRISRPEKENTVWKKLKQLLRR